MLNNIEQVTFHSCEGNSQTLIMIVQK